MKEIIITYLPKILEYVIVIIAGLLANKAKKLINTDIKKAIVRDTVKYVEQVFRDVHGAEKLDAAKDKAIALLKEKGVKISDEEIIVLIESAVSEMNKNDSAIKQLIEMLETGTIDDFDVKDVQNRDGDS